MECQTDEKFLASLGQDMDLGHAVSLELDGHQLNSWTPAVDDNPALPTGSSQQPDSQTDEAPPIDPALEVEYAQALESFVADDIQSSAQQPQQTGGAEMKIDMDTSIRDPDGRFATEPEQTQGFPADAPYNPSAPFGAGTVQMQQMQGLQADSFYNPSTPFGTGTVQMQGFQANAPYNPYALGHNNFADTFPAMSSIHPQGGFGPGSVNFAQFVTQDNSQYPDPLSVLLAPNPYSQDMVATQAFHPWQSHPPMAPTPDVLPTPNHNVDSQPNDQTSGSPVRSRSSSPCQSPNRVSYDRQAKRAGDPDTKPDNVYLSLEVPSPWGPVDEEGRHLFTYQRSNLVKQYERGRTKARKARQKKREAEDEYETQQDRAELDKIERLKLQKARAKEAKRQSSEEREEGMLDRDRQYTAAEIRYYIDNCPRSDNLTLWVQRHPSQVSDRVPDGGIRCFWECCPYYLRKINNGFYQVAFDEYSRETTRRKRDPFKVAGHMHLYCYERCFDPVHDYKRGKLKLETRMLTGEEKNPMAVDQQHTKHIKKAAWDPWFKKNDPGVNAPPRTERRPFKETLASALTEFHLANEVGCRQKVREQRNLFKAEGSKNTIDYHRGDLMYWCRRSGKKLYKYADPDYQYDQDNDFQVDPRASKAYQDCRLGLGLGLENADMEQLRQVTQGTSFQPPTDIALPGLPQPPTTGDTVHIALPQPALPGKRKGEDDRNGVQKKQRRLVEDDASLEGDTIHVALPQPALPEKRKRVVDDEGKPENHEDDSNGVRRSKRLRQSSFQKTIRRSWNDRFEPSNNKKNKPSNNGDELSDSGDETSDNRDEPSNGDEPNAS